MTDTKTSPAKRNCDGQPSLAPATGSAERPATHKKKGLQIEWCRDIPVGARDVATRRTCEMLQHYGRNITSLNIETLVVSCYLQGVNDCFELQEKRAAALPNIVLGDGKPDSENAKNLH